MLNKALLFIFTSLSLTSQAAIINFSGVSVKSWQY
jgi:hypothetical protein